MRLRLIPGLLMASLCSLSFTTPCAAQVIGSGPTAVARVHASSVTDPRSGRNLRDDGAVPSSFTYRQEELLSHMTPRCAQLFEAQLKGFAPRTQATVGRGVREEFLLQCPDAVARARVKLFHERMAPQAAKAGQLSQEREAAQGMAASQDARRAQCAELNSLLSARRKRIDAMNEGERADLQRFEATYSSRCS